MGAPASNTLGPLYLERLHWGYFAMAGQPKTLSSVALRHWEA
jgi:hypothetical protein